MQRLNGLRPTAFKPSGWRSPEALALALLGKDAAGLSASAVGRLKDGWFDEHAAWQKRDLSAKRYVYIWADGIHLEARLEDEKQCILVLIGATPEGRKELIGFTDGSSRSSRAVRMPIAQNSPAVRSATGMPTRIGPSPGAPVIDISPPMPCAI